MDIKIVGGTVIDGQNGDRFEADIGIKEGVIHTVGDLSGTSAANEIDATGRIVAPGFIDVHTHDDFAALLHPDMGFKLVGGVTTCVVGNCGFGAAPFTEACVMGKAMHPDLSLSPYDGYHGYLDRLRATAPGVNIGVLAGHGTLRLAAMGTDDREPSGAEMAAMRGLLDEGIEAGVLGLSSGLIYEPGRYAQTQELIELASQLRDAGGLYATHMRDEGEQLLESVEEAIAIGAGAGVPVQISHHKASGRESWGRVVQSLALIDAAQARGESVHADQYPYTAGSTILKAVLENGAFLNRDGGMGRVSADDVIIASAAECPQWEGQSIATIAAALEMPARAAAEHVISRVPGATVVLHLMDEEDVKTVMRHASTMIGSDGIPTLNGRPHPRLYNSFARVLGHYARDEKLFSLETAVYRMTGFSAEKFGLAGRGVIAEGNAADVVVFDAERIIDRGTFEEPNLYPDGIDCVIVNGNVAVNNGTVTAHRYGQPLRRGR
ncbi:MAG: D-aminoacylase [Gammaproteobacteria bacterium]|nr:D-aminoacylase [Gammaproteobacteria bacterium]